MFSLFLSDGFIPHGHCYLWQPTLVWLNILSDGGIALSYYVIPFFLLTIARKREDLPFRSLFWLFGFFIVTCGTTHVMDVWTLWHPVYWLAAGLKLITAMISMATAALLFHWLPPVLALPSPLQLEAANIKLQLEIAEHERTETALQRRKALLRDAQRLARLGTWELDVATQERHWSEELFNLFRINSLTVPPPSETLLQRMHPDSRQKLEQALDRAIHEGSSYEMELQYQHAEGDIAWFCAQGEAVLNQSGSVVKLVGTIQEITEQKQTTLELELHSVITRNMAEGICLVRVADGVFVYVNPKFERMFGYEPDELKGCHVSIVNYAEDENGAEAVNQTIRHQVLDSGEATYEVQNVKKDGTPFWCQATTALFEHPMHGSVLVAVQQDITERRGAEDVIKQSLKEKEVLLQEIHHRVKNNLQIVYSLLRLQQRQAVDPKAASILLESQSRIEAIALVHEKLYHAGDLAHINASEYISSLVSNLVSTYNLKSNQIDVQFDIEALPLNIDQAVPCGLIINELISNALKYAFPNQREGGILVRLKADEVHPCCFLTVADDGVGLPANIRVAAEAKTLGLQLVADFAEQLKGELHVESTHGTLVRVRFPSFATKP